MFKNMSTTVSLFKKDFYQRLGGLEIFRNKKVLDVGCGDGEDALHISEFAKGVVGIDIQVHDNWKSVKNSKLKFELGVGEKLPFKSNSFDALFIKDVLHHVDDIEKTLKEVRRVVARGGLVVVVEGNRYNPLFYIHMTKFGGHEHLPQKKFKAVIRKYFRKSRFVHFESHFIPFINEPLFKFIIFVEKAIGRIGILKPILSYNVAISKNEK